MASDSILWRPEDTTPPVPAQPNGEPFYRPDVLETIEAKIHDLDAELRALSLDIHAHPELGFEEYHAHDVLTKFMEGHGFEVTRQYTLATAWSATFTHGSGGRVIGVNSEMDALKGIGHACGHNLIAIAGVAVACTLREVLIKHNINGKIVLLGTPAEEGGSGKVLMLEKDAYKEMDVCLMCHPAPGPKGSVSLSSCLALHRVEVEFRGHTAHAALSPWEGVNAQDAAVLAYNNLSVLRQQIRPTHRIHGIIEGKDWAPNIIPDYAKMTCYVRAPTAAEVDETYKRVRPCFEAAALATGCSVEIKTFGITYDLRQNRALGEGVRDVVLKYYGDIDYEWGIKSASTDFGNITYALPSLHPGFAIPTVNHGGNHTPEFTQYAATPEAHKACLDVSKALAAVGFRVLDDDKFFAHVKKTFEEDKLARGVA
ncbi:hypothetical protein AX16_004830 [Volvariella volvacea WC 439]|nr:hypothetical protein AX16_004830 [Volvariella volvacea WC 439]